MNVLTNLETNNKSKEIDEGNFIENLYNKKVTVKLIDYTVIEGILLSIDGIMNLVLEKGVEITDNNKLNLGSVFIRGSNVAYISCC